MFSAPSRGSTQHEHHRYRRLLHEPAAPAVAGESPCGGSTLRAVGSRFALAASANRLRHSRIPLLLPLRCARRTSSWLCLALGIRLADAEFASSPLLGGNM